MTQIDDTYTRKEWEALLDNAEGAASTEWEQEFVADLREKYTKFGPSMFLSEKQSARLEAIAERGASW